MTDFNKTMKTRNYTLNGRKVINLPGRGPIRSKESLKAIKKASYMRPGDYVWVDIHTLPVMFERRLGDRFDYFYMDGVDKWSASDHCCAIYRRATKKELRAIRNEFKQKLDFYTL